MKRSASSLAQTSKAAVVADEAAALLSEFDRRVRHYELVIMDEPESQLTSSSVRG